MYFELCICYLNGQITAYVKFKKKFGLGKKTFGLALRWLSLYTFIYPLQRGTSSILLYSRILFTLRYGNHWQQVATFLDSPRREKNVQHLLEINWLGFPSGSVVKNPPLSAGDMGSIPDQGTFHRPQSN